MYRSIFIPGLSSMQNRFLHIYIAAMLIAEPASALPEQAEAR
jgi:hypothetical protein